MLRAVPGRNLGRKWHEMARSQTKHDLFIQAILAGVSVVEAAKKSNISERTGRRWLQEASVQDALRKGRQQAFGLAISALSDVATEAVRVLRQIIMDNSVAAGVRVRACLGVLDLAHNAEANEVMTKLEELEEQLAEYMSNE